MQLTTIGEIQRPIHRLTKLPFVVTIKNKMTISDADCCRNRISDASAGLWSAFNTVLMVLKMKLMQKYAMRMHIGASNGSSDPIFKRLFQFINGEMPIKAIIIGRKMSARRTYVVLTYFRAR
jgi:hypothetical protein